jgi:YgiT-type zinc finger domain-containing protein
MKEAKMKSCNFCGNKNLKNIEVDYTYKKDDKYLIVNSVPCIQCEYCGEQYFQAKILKQIENEFMIIQSGKKVVEKKLIVPVETFSQLSCIN